MLFRGIAMESLKFTFVVLKQQRMKHWISRILVHALKKSNFLCVNVRKQLAFDEYS